MSDEKEVYKNDSTEEALAVASRKFRAARRPAADSLRCSKIQTI